VNWFNYFPLSGDLPAWAAALGAVLTAVTIPWVLVTKKDSTSAVAWCLLVLLLPLLGPVLFFLLGYQHVYRPLQRKRRHQRHFKKRHPASQRELLPGLSRKAPPDTTWEGMGHLAQRLGAFPVTPGNAVTLYHDGPPAFDAMFEAIRSARHHAHLEFFIFQRDATGRRFLELLARKAREGVEVRLVYDAMGTRHLSRSVLREFWAAGGKSCAFLPINPLRKRMQVNMRNHRKILVVDGRVGFTGGLNIGTEYTSADPRWGFWRDTHLRLEGPAVAGLQRVFIEDWDFASGEHLQGPQYFAAAPAGNLAVQVVQAGPDQDDNAIRDVYFAAAQRARHRLWIMSPYFVPDAGLRDALRLAGYRGLDVRLLCQYHPDKWIPYFAARYYWGEVLDAGVQVYQYTKGMMHAKVVLADGEWASVGSANFDNRSLHLNFEVNCLLYARELVAELEEAFRHDLRTAIRLDRQVYARRPFAGRLVENGCRLLSPVL
jgi:cardiolipin synthase